MAVQLMAGHDDDARAVEVPWEQLDAHVLRRLVEEFVTREGTEYGEQDVSLPAKVDAVLAQLRLKTAAITFDPETQSTSVVVVG